MSATEKTMSRRGFLGVAGVTGASAAVVALAGCSAGQANNTESSASASTDADASAAAAGQDNVSPIEPLKAPEKWDSEVDVVVGGSGSGLVAALRAAQLGAKVAVFDPAGSWGGSSKETDIIAIVGSKYQTKLFESIDLESMGMPGVTLADMLDEQMGGHDEATMKAVMTASYLPQPGGSTRTASGVSTASSTGSAATGGAAIAQGHPETVKALLDSQADMIDWLAPQLAENDVVLGPVTGYGENGMMFLCPDGSEAGGFVARANYTVFESLYNMCEEAGVTFSFNNAITGLVTDDEGAVIGIQAADGTYTKAGKGVLLATGGMASNVDMMQRYCPTVDNGCFTSTATTTDDGSGIRMGLGAGGYVDGMDTANCFDGGLMTKNRNHYLYKGDTQFVRNIPSLFNIRGERVPWYSLYTIGFTDQAPILMGQPGGFAIAVTDANYETMMAESQEPICRKPITPEMMEAAGANADRMPESVLEHDWHEGFQQGLDGGWIVKADSIEELAEKLGVNAENLQKGVDEWNKVCEAGEDDLFQIDPALLRPIEDAPFYGAKENGTILNTYCGLGCDPATSAALTLSGNPIPGLYVGGSTIGGLGGSGGLAGSTVGGGVGYAMGTCYTAAGSMMA